MTLENVQRKEEQTTEATYRIKGKLGFWESPPADPDYFCGHKLDESFTAPDDAIAVQKARTIIEEFLAEHPEALPDPENKLTHSAWRRYHPHFDFWLEKCVWELHYEPSREGTAAIPEVPSEEATVLERSPA